MFLISVTNFDVYGAVILYRGMEFFREKKSLMLWIPKFKTEVEEYGMIFVVESTTTDNFHKRMWKNKNYICMVHPERMKVKIPLSKL